MGEYCEKGRRILDEGDGAAIEQMSLHVDGCSVCARALRSEKINSTEQKKEEVISDRLIVAAMVRRRKVN